jgi:hypothetical protein
MQLLPKLPRPSCGEHDPFCLASQARHCHLCHLSSFDVPACLQTSEGVATDALLDLKACQEASHYLVMHNRAKEKAWHEVAAKAATTLLRYTRPVSFSDTGPAAPIVPLDKALFLAGSSWREV